jgi:D-amino-acid dehydrogenase
MQIAVVGGGVAGVCTAYFLAAAGHQTVVLERYSNVALETSFGNAGLMAPAHAAPWAAPGMPQKLLSYLFKPESPAVLKPGVSPTLWRWMRRWLAECDIERFQVNKLRMQRLALYSNELMHLLREHYALQYEQTSGLLQLFRSQTERTLAQPLLALLEEAGLPHRLIHSDDARLIEPALAYHTPLNSALHLPGDEAGNCPLFTRQLRAIAQEMGVVFHFDSAVDAIEADRHGVTLSIGQQRFGADAVVIAAGYDSLPLLRQLGIRVPLYPAKAYSASVAIRNFEQAPLASVADESYKVSITRLGTRVRVAGTVELGFPAPELREAALRTLVKVGEDWFPDAANYNASSFWSGVWPMLPDGVPLVGPTAMRNVHLNIGHSASGWGMAAGSGKLVADLISGQATDIDTEGLTLARYG